MQILLPTVLALLLSISAHALESSEAAVRGAVTGLMGSSSEQHAAVIELTALNDPKADLVLQALLDRTLYLWRSSGGEELHVIAGDEREIDGEKVLSLYHAYGREPIEPMGGATLTAKRRDLKSVLVSRQARKLGLALLRLDSADAQERRAAAVYMGRQEDPALIPLLADAHSVERSRWTSRAMEEAIQIIRLSDADTTVRSDAVGQLGGLHSIYALTVFREILESGTESDPSAVSGLEDAILKIERWRFLTKVIQTGWSGISLASILAIIAIGLAITFGLMKVINMAHGELMLVGAYATYLIQNVFRDVMPGPFFAVYPILAIPVAFAAAASLRMGVSNGVYTTSLTMAVAGIWAAKMGEPSSSGPWDTSPLPSG